MYVKVLAVAFIKKGVLVVAMNVERYWTHIALEKLFNDLFLEMTTRLQLYLVVPFCLKMNVANFGIPFSGIFVLEILKYFSSPRVYELRV